MLFSTGTALTMTDCTINGANAARGGGAIAGGGASSCVLSGVSFTGCSASQGNILYGNTYSDTAGAPAYKVKPGCKVNGTTVTAGNLSSLASQCYLVNGSTIEFSP